jgi:hypothetical protein
MSTSSGLQVKAVMMKDELLARGRLAADINEGIVVPLLDNLLLADMVTGG